MKSQYRGICGSCGGIAVGFEALSNALGGEVYVHLVTLSTEDAVNEECVHAGERLCESIRCTPWSTYRMFFPKAFGQAL